MGIFSKNNKGKRCTVREDGSQECQIFKTDGTEKLGTGSRWVGKIDPNSCKSYLDDTYDILEEDWDAVKDHLKEMEKSCRGVG